MNEREKSDRPVLPGKPPNNAARAAAEVVEGRGLRGRNAASKTPPGPSAGQGAPSALGRVRRIAQQDNGARFTALLHHVDIDRLRVAYFALRPKAAPGWMGSRGRSTGWISPVPPAYPFSLCIETLAAVARRRGVSRRYHSASSAAWQPEPAAVTAWR